MMVYKCCAIMSGEYIKLEVVYNVNTWTLYNMYEFLNEDSIVYICDSFIILAIRDNTIGRVSKLMNRLGKQNVLESRINSFTPSPLQIAECQLFISKHGLIISDGYVRSTKTLKDLFQIFKCGYCDGRSCQLICKYCADVNSLINYYCGNKGKNVHNMVVTMRNGTHNISKVNFDNLQGLLCRCVRPICSNCFGVKIPHSISALSVYDHIMVLKKYMDKSIIQINGNYYLHYQHSSINVCTEKICTCACADCEL